MKRILLQLDTDPIPSSFDRVVAIDAGAEEVLAYGGVTPDNVESLVHGAIFTRGPKELANTAIFIGGSDVQAAEKVFAKVSQTFFGPMRVSVMLDPSGSSTTAAAAVRLASKHIALKENDALVLGGTGPVGQRTAQILASQGTRVRVASRTAQRAESTAALIRGRVEGATVTPCEWSDDGLAAAVDSIEMLFAAGAAGVSFLTADEWQSVETLKVAIDLNAVPPVGLEGIAPTDQAVDHNGIAVYGALGVGGFKMKLHRAAIEKLFTANNLVLDTDAIYALSGNL
ncbi:NAD(P)-dependent methylenetetrahydromethanopterin dehydrogenase [Planctomicrobium piriforme]|uniref:Methylene-tetrahydromethanopterin dehydrogenase, N-terminal n=1 Tax=Planctomicrobium piriforme TaxID=1576369 RepID=A0A1I3K2P7_9PLAN|nr:NAD(P)-dependent methylenetetrahydromethanopterin dehydrogenase [Planctomicrobium piriforme]SFI66578.1 Methylene-tetrahydromethanopterin dehydrogenase, N-terminal [Planctomicrobium piriforme]